MKAVIVFYVIYAQNTITSHHILMEKCVEEMLNSFSASNELSMYSLQCARFLAGEGEVFSFASCSSTPFFAILGTKDKSQSEMQRINSKSRYLSDFRATIICCQFDASTYVHTHSRTFTIFVRNLRRAHCK